MASRVSQEVGVVVHAPTSELARVSQEAAVIVHSPTSEKARVSQVVAVVVYSNVAPLRQLILQSQDSDTQATRDGIGGSALTNAKRAVVRGSCSVYTQAGGWFPGQGVALTSTPLGISNVTYMLQRVSTEFISGVGDRKIEVDFGDAPVGTIGLRRTAQALGKAGTTLGGNSPIRPAVRMLVTASQYGPGPSGMVRVTAQAVDPSGNAWPIAGKTVAWSVSVFDTNGNDATGYTTYVLSSTSSTTDARGLAWTDLTVSATNNLTYYVGASLGGGTIPLLTGTSPGIVVGIGAPGRQPIIPSP